MAAANVIVPKGIPIFLVGNCGTHPNVLNVFVSKTVPAQIEQMSSILDGFQSLVLRERGILLIEINDRTTLEQFAKIFQLSIKTLKFSDIKINIFSNQDEILNSRNLTQFTFIRTMKLNTDLKKLGSMLIRDYRELESRSSRQNNKFSSSNSEIIIIKGGKAEPQSSGQIKTLVPEKKENPLQACVGPTVPSFLYDKSCSWRVRGHFFAFDESNRSITFKPDDQSGLERLNLSLKETKYLISSTSSVHARVCMTLDFVGRNDEQFIFKTPTMVQEVQRRTEQRLRVSDEYPVVCQFFDPKAETDIALTVLDLSSGGIGVRMDKDLISNYQLEQMIGNVLLIFSQRIIKVKAVEVRHLSRSDTNPDFKILGLQFLEIDSKDKAFIDMYVESRSTLKPD